MFVVVENMWRLNNYTNLGDREENRDKRWCRWHDA